MAHIDDPDTQKANLAYIKTSMNAPMLEKEHEFDLARRWRDDKDEAALHEMIQSYTRLVISVASKFKHYGLPLGDLIQEGNIGLMQAANRFDPERDIRFSTYATWWIRSCIQDYVLRNWSIVRTGTTAAQKSLFFNFRRLRAKIEGNQEKEGLNNKDRKKIAKELGVKVKEVEAMEGRLAANDQSLNGFVGEDGNAERLDFLVDENQDPEKTVIGMKDSQARSKWLSDALSKLTDREQKIIKERHLTYDGVTLEKLGNDLGVSKERVRQLEQRAMMKLKTTLQKETPDVRNFFLEE
ncbi:MAG: RNA polymerase factor sigma-32 [Micavibrio sp.]|nr:RNA polymerase factor sigma-32 [Micavibrio sp.]